MKMRNKKRTVSVIIPAHNEEKTLGKVLRALEKTKYAHEVICVDDGSTDHTLSVIRKFPQIKAISLSKNRGKAFALAKGILEAKGDIVVFIDADLEGITDVAISRMIKPLVSGQYDVVIGYPYNAIDKPFIPIMGERAYFKKDLLPFVSKMRSKGYGVELFLNYQFRKRKIAIVALPKIRHIQKYEKQPYHTVARLMIRESWDIMREIFQQDNPPLYLKHAYLDNFYINRLPQDSL